MLIDGYDYHFAYTVGAYCDLSDLHIEPPTTRAAQCKVIIQTALLTAKAYEDRQKCLDPSYKVNYLKMEQLRNLSVNDVFDRLAPEVNAAIEEGKYRTVEAEEIKNVKGAEQ